MWRNYLVIAVRNLRRHRLYSLINILGLAVGMACCILIALYVLDELSYDRFHAYGDRIYRVVRENVGGEISPRVEVQTSGALAPALERDFPEVERTVRLMGLTAGIWVRYRDRVFEQVFRTVDAGFLEVFSFPMISGDRRSVFRDPYTVVMTASAARQFFGEEDPIGKIITCEDTFFEGDYRVTGILKDMPANSSLQFDMLTATVSRRFRESWEHWRGPASWRPLQTYALLAEGVSRRELEEKLSSSLERYMGTEAATKLSYHLQPLHRIHLYSGADYGMSRDFGLLPYGDMNRVYLFGAIACLILIIACTNYMNLATARSVGRAREVGVRQVAGAHRTQVMGQFLTESILLAAIALCLGLAMAEVALPALNAFSGKTLSIDAGIHYGAPALVGFAVLVGLLAGGYPAFFISGFRPVVALKGWPGLGTRGTWVRKGLVVFQFAITIVLIAATAGVHRQLDYIGRKRLGYNPELLLTMPIFGMDRKMQTASQNRLALRYNTVKREFLKHPNVLKATAFRWDMGPEGGGMLYTVRAEGVGGDEWQMRVQEADEDFLDTYEIPLVAGRNFSPEIQSDLTEAFILNETAVKMIGWKDPLGKILAWGNRRGAVIGVVKDYHDRSLREKIAPTAIVFKVRLFWSLSVRIQADDMPETLASLERIWKQFMPTRPFMYSFVDENLAMMYRSEMKLGRMAGVFSGLAVFLACLGLFGLISFSAEQRTKEIGIRKTLGASVIHIVLLLSRDFVKLVILANVIAWPVAYYAIATWLQRFVYRVDPGAGIFMLGGALALLIALATVSFQAVKAALANPVDALRYE